MTVWTNGSELKSDIKQWTLDESTELADALDSIIAHAEYRIFRQLDIPHFVETDTATTTDGDPFLTLPSTSEIVRVRYVKVGDAALEYRPQNFLAEYWPDRTQTGAPKYFARWDEATLLLAPTPDASLSLEMNYTIKPAGITDVSSTYLSDNYPELLFAACLSEAFAYKKDNNLYQAWEQQYQNRLQAAGAEQQRATSDVFTMG